MSTTGRLVSRPAATTRLRRSRSVTRPNRLPSFTSKTEEMRCACMTRATSMIGVSGGSVTGGRWIRLRTGVLIRLA